MRLFWLLLVSLLVCALPATAQASAHGGHGWTAADAHPYSALLQAPGSVELLVGSRSEGRPFDASRPAHGQLAPPAGVRLLRAASSPSTAVPLRPLAERLPYDATAPPLAA